MKITESFRFEIIDQTGIISLDVPPENYLPAPGFIPLELFEKWTQPDKIKGLIIKGQGRNFSAGGNLELIYEASKYPGELQQLTGDGIELLNRIQDLEIPVIAALNRVCFGGGLEIALACHIRIASENALLAFPEVNQNLMPGMGGTFRLPGVIGLPASLKMILGGDLINANTAMELGLIDYLTPKDQAFEYAMNMMHRMIHDRPIKVIKSIMKSLKNSRILSREEAMAEETRLFCELASDEAERRKTEGI